MSQDAEGSFLLLKSQGQEDSEDNQSPGRPGKAGEKEPWGLQQPFPLPLPDSPLHSRGQVLLSALRPSCGPWLQASLFPTVHISTEPGPDSGPWKSHLAQISHCSRYHILRPWVRPNGRYWQEGETVPRENKTNYSCHNRHGLLVMPSRGRMPKNDGV